VGPTNVFVLVLSRHKPVDRTTCSPTSAATTGIVFRAKSTGISQPNQSRHVQNLCRSQLSRFQSICDKGSFGVRLKILYIRQNSLPILMAIGKKRSRFTSIAALRSAPRRTDQLWCLHSALNDACQLKSLNTIGGSGHAGYRLRKAGDAPTPSVDLHSIRRLCNYVSR